MVLAVGSVNAQDLNADQDKYMFNHLGGSISFGTDGIGIELATPITPYVNMRAGVSFYPKINVTVKDIDYTITGKSGKGKVEASFQKIDGKLLFDAYPFGLKNSFHVTAGLFIGRKNIITASFIEDPTAPIGAGINKTLDNGEQWIVEADPNTHAIDLRVRTNAVKPYVGIGFGRAIPKKRVNVACDIGVQFQGKPKLDGYASLTTMSGVSNKWVQLESNDFHFDESFNKDVDKAFDISNKVVVWPVLNIRVTGRFF